MLCCGQRDGVGIRKADRLIYLGLVTQHRNESDSRHI
jgi:hypothetical protein